MNNGIILSSRVRFARNLKDYKFVSKLANAEANKLITQIQQLLMSASLKTAKLDDLDESTIQYLLEKRLISQLLIDNRHISALSVNNAEDVCIMINEEDHLRAQSIVNGMDLFGAYKKIKSVMDVIENSLSLAYDDEYGYLCTCPTNVGSAMRASVRMCLPALVKTNQMSKIINDLSQLGITVRGDYGEGSQQQGYTFQISNYASLGLDEMEVINKVQFAVMRLQELEMSARRALYNDRPVAITDMARRSYGLLKSCYTIKYSEMLEWIANVKLGTSLGLVDADVDKLDHILRHAPYAIMSYETKSTFTIDEYNLQLAKFIQQTIKEN